MSAERVCAFTFEGFGYSCRIVENSAPRTEPIVVLAGAYQDMYAFKRHEAPWTAAATVVSVDLPGSGTADDLPATLGFDFLAATVDHMLAELALGKVNVFGSSYGSVIAYELARTTPDALARLALAGLAPVITPDERQKLRVMIDCLEAGQLDEYVNHSVERLVCPHPGRLRNRGRTARVLQRVMRSMTAPDVPRQIESTRRLLEWEGLPPGGIGGVPALIVTGEHDRLTPPDAGRGVAATIEGARFVSVREADHLLHLERGTDVADLLLRFFTDEPLEGLDCLNLVECPSAAAPAAGSALAPGSVPAPGSGAPSGTAPVPAAMPLPRAVPARLSR